MQTQFYMQWELESNCVCPGWRWGSEKTWDDHKFIAQTNLWHSDSLQIKFIKIKLSKNICLLNANPEEENIISRIITLLYSNVQFKNITKHTKKKKNMACVNGAEIKATVFLTKDLMAVLLFKDFKTTNWKMFKELKETESQKNDV